MDGSSVTFGVLDIGGVRLDNRLVLAPMAGYTDSAFRLICREFGCGLTCTEMISAKGLIYRNRRTIEMLKFDERERPISMQIFGHEPGEMAEAVAIIKDLAPRLPDVLDINMGCPTPKIVKNGDGAALMKEPVLAGKVIERVVEAAGGVFPVTVKIRKGWDSAHANAVEIARIAEQSGANAVIIHGRTREQFYRGKADWDVIGQVKSSVRIPVIGNGDVTTPELAAEMMSTTGCDGVMIGRGALGNPWIFGRTAAGPPTVQARIDLCIHHLELFLQLRGPERLKEMRKHVAHYLKGIRGSASARKAINRASTEEEFRAILEGLYLEGL